MAVIPVWCYDDGTNSMCWDDFATAIDTNNMPHGPGPCLAFRKAAWNTTSRVLKYNVAGDMARLYRSVIAGPNITLPDTATVTVGATPTTSLQVVRSDT